MLPLWADGVYEALRIIALQKRVGVEQKRKQDVSEEHKELRALGSIGEERFLQFHLFRD